MTLKVGERLVERTLDGRYRWFEMPAAMLEILCRYDEVVATELWQVLARTDRECGQPVMLSSVTKPAGAPVIVPDAPPGTFLTVRVRGVDKGLIEDLRGLVWKAEEWYIRMDRAPIRRLVPGTAADGLLLAVPDSILMHGDYAFGPPVKSIRVEAGKDGSASSALLTYEFWSTPLGAG